MGTNQSRSHHKSRDQDGPNAGEEDNEDTQHNQDPEGLAVAESAAEDEEGLIGGAEEVEEKPRSEKPKEQEERERIGYERESQDEAENRQVIDTEVGVVFADAEGGFGEGFRFGEGGAIDEFGPRTALGEAIAEGFGDVVDQGAESGGGDRGLGLGGGGGGGGLGIGEGEDRRSGGGHFWVA